MDPQWDGQSDHAPDVQRARGDAIRRELWGPQAGARLEVLKRFEPDLADLVVREVFGTIYADDRLSLETRSLCTIACLIAQGQFRQVESHMRAAMRIGVPVETLSALLVHLLFYTGLPLVLNAFHTLASIIDETAVASGKQSK